MLPVRSITSCALKPSSTETVIPLPRVLNSATKARFSP